MTHIFEDTMNTPTVQPLPRGHRRFVFLGLVTLFLCAVPVFVFYATGYRYNFFATHGSGITTTGGLYISVLSDTGTLFVDEAPVHDVRIFRKALYIQNILPSVHHVHVQASGLTTWVKNLPVYPYIVTEAEAFLMPTRPQVRLITPYQTATGTPVFSGMSSSTKILPFASTSLPYLVTQSRSTSTLIRNPEYSFITGLFSSSTIATTTALHLVLTDMTKNFRFANTSTVATPSRNAVSTTTRIYHNIVLSERHNDIYAQYIGSPFDIPYYFCIPYASLASTTDLYGAQAMKGSFEAMVAAETPPVSDLSRTCRSQIKIDTQGKRVYYFNFLPGSSDLVFEFREDGIFVVEIDDRSWQNTERLYPASAENVTINNGRIYVLDHGVYFELLTTLIAP